MVAVRRERLTHGPPECGARRSVSAVYQADTSTLREPFHKVGYTGGRSRRQKSRCRRAAAGEGEPGKKPQLFIRSFREVPSGKCERAGSAAGASYTLVGGNLVLGGIGYAVDHWRGTSPGR